MTLHDDNNDKVTWRQIYGLINLYQRNIKIYVLVMGHCKEEVRDLIDNEIYFLVVSIDKIWLYVDRPTQLNSLILNLLDEIDHILSVHGDIVVSNSQEKSVSVKVIVFDLKEKILIAKKL